MAVTIKSIARALNVNASTVSRALRGDSRVKETTRLRVVRLAKELGYRPNLAARSLVGGRADMLWLLAPGLADPFHARFAEQAAEAASARGYDLLTALYPEADESRERLLNRLAQGGADGAMAIPSLKGDEADLFRITLPAGFPLLFVERSPRALDAPVVSTDQAACCRELVRSCSEAGARFFLLLFSDDPFDSIEAIRLASAAAEIERLGHSFAGGEDLHRRWRTRFLSEGVAILASTQETLLSFLVENGETFRNKALSLGVFDEWRGRVAPAQRVFVCRRDAEAVARLAVGQLIDRIEQGTALSTASVAPESLETLDDLS